MMTFDTEVFEDHACDLPSSMKSVCFCGFLLIQEYILLEVRVVEDLLQGNRDFGIRLLKVEVPIPSRP